MSRVLCCGTLMYTHDSILVFHHFSSLAPTIVGSRRTSAMAILNYIYVTSAATPISPEPPIPPVREPRPTKIILPKNKPMKWSTGVAPGDYGGPPTTSKLRKYWGGEEDPLASDDFMWNKDFVGRFQKLIQDKPQSSIEATPTKEEPSGFLSLTRVMSLDSLEVDLSKELSAPVNHIVDNQIEPTPESSESNRVRWRSAPTRREQEKWDRATKAATGGSDVMLGELKQSREDPAVLAARSKEQYAKLKLKLQILTLGIGSVGLLSAYVSYSPEIAASFGAGLLGSLVYIRMLGNSVDSLRTDGAKALVKGAVGQPRLLIPVVLVMLYSRWNEILVPEYGYMHLELIPMLVGFFTYKIATFAQAIEDVLTVPVKKT